MQKQEAEYKQNYNQLLEENRFLKEKINNYHKSKEIEYKKHINNLKASYDREIEK